MNKYRDKSDFDINKDVAEKTGKPFSLNGEIIFVKADAPPGIIPYSVIFDPCNNPADAMPIVIESKITIAYDRIGNTWCAHAGSVMDDCGWDYKITPAHYAYSDNYYRAAMEVFLVMKDAE